MATRKPLILRPMNHLCVRRCALSGRKKRTTSSTTWLRYHLGPRLECGCTRLAREAAESSRFRSMHWSNLSNKRYWWSAVRGHYHWHLIQKSSSGREGIEDFISKRNSGLIVLMVALTLLSLISKSLRWWELLGFNISTSSLTLNLSSTLQKAKTES